MSFGHSLLCRAVVWTAAEEGREWSDRGTILDILWDSTRRNKVQDRHNRLRWVYTDAPVRQNQGYFARPVFLAVLFGPNSSTFSQNLVHMLFMGCACLAFALGLIFK